jgi:hypothetical protein
MIFSLLFWSGFIALLKKAMFKFASLEFPIAIKRFLQLFVRFILCSTISFAGIDSINACKISSLGLEGEQ